MWGDGNAMVMLVVLMLPLIISLLVGGVVGGDVATTNVGDSGDACDRDYDDDVL